MCVCMYVHVDRHNIMHTRLLQVAVVSRLTVTHTRMHTLTNVAYHQNIIHTYLLQAIVVSRLTVMLSINLGSGAWSAERFAAVCVYVCLCLCGWVSMCVRVYVYIYTYIYTYTYTYTYIGSDTWCADIYASMRVCMSVCVYV
jgi:hypothetical protein